ncbi:IS4 family transposase [Haloimpatiens sp. FM7315]|uniref:IS4 family transposase n=1 Tax=Haloimpatiens sp. FM7315 TaxID=3298609 RepID=UPI00370C20AE
MHKRLKKLIEMISEIFEENHIEKVGKITKFVQRKSSLSAKEFLAFNIFSSHDMCDKSLAKLCSRMEAQSGILISPQALNQRYNAKAVEFMRQIFVELLCKQNKLLENEKNNLKILFNRVILNDATSFILPKEFKEEFKGSGGSASGAAVKIQLQYELLTGQFMCCDIEKGSRNDADYLGTMSKYIKPKDLKLADLGYYKVSYLKEIDDKKAFFISKIKSDTRIYKKNPNPERHKNGNIKKSTQYIKIDISELITPLREGESIELKDIYIGSKKHLKARLIVTKLTSENKKKREIKHKRDVQKKRGTNSKRSVAWLGINTYITNISMEMLSPLC